ncbi:dicarboxylate/amino acid:cation symporter [Thermoanaerobacter sp. CM-CNRG TB177]|uniref:Sodium:dicarboxylate symporter n=2 Tax=Thermoanaerobacter TaxID=1754 RepID=B0K9H6_THEP3|nr:MULTISPECIES: dicarboxylate/amino acid:cation symporter [Thermoanaerobacter]MBT1279864.1 dicarboxylate/amino acid:cation symporter [Thermoanaerobacter sp. CM-CNRG TB177]ABY94789.1 sodium:dicarboxylate symporter [Thermoanaerobacter pseudethanolicus ATCC 33223]ADV79738.1 sodium:dicarboxylate symporter [Thermoanaerobacter brockii subsp. finnii Ako-1]MDK2814218.1 hypothetical protein [Thermoanaerobacter sp.]HBW58765.1 dicarboxylate/amino acid:cation symporter [Thermoanaerobacter sp.]
MKVKFGIATKIFIALIVGVFVGLLLTPAPDVASTYIKPFGELFLNLIRMMVVPLVLSSLIVGTASLGDVKKLGRIGAKTIAYYLLTTALAITIGIILANIIKPGTGITLPVEEVEIKGEPPLITPADLVPSNPVKAMAEGNMLQIIVFAIFLGIAITLVGEKGKPVLDFFNSLAEISYKIVWIIMEYYAPIGVFALIVPVVADHGPSLLLPLGKLIITGYLGFAIQLFMVYSALVWIFTRMNPVKFFKSAAPAMLTAYTTSSSSGTLPVTMEVTEKKLGVSKSICSFVLPLGATINMDGTALHLGISVLFTAQLYGVELSLSQQLAVLLTATMFSIGTAGVPGVSIFFLPAILQTVGLPLGSIALIAGIDRILDMGRTLVNVTGDMAGSVVIAATEKELNRT